MSESVDVRIRSVSILRGGAREAALAVGADGSDLVILKTIIHTDQFGARRVYSAEKIIGDPLAYLMRTP